MMEKLIVVFLVLFSLSVLPSSVVSRLTAKDVILINGTAAWDRFLEYPLPVHWKIHYFDISGWENFTGDVSKLQYREVGPYVYDQSLTREPINYRYEQGGNNLTYVLRREFKFNQELTGSALHGSDLVTIVNPVLAMPFKSIAKELVATDSVESFSFNGTHKFLSFIRFSFFTGEGLDGDWYAAEEEPLPISTGTRYPGEVMQVLGFMSGHENVWQNPIKLPGTSGPCNEPRGTDGTAFEPNMKPTDRLETYEPLMCRSFSYHRMENVEVRGIKAMRFVTDEENYDNKQLQNQCYCYPEGPQTPQCADDTLSLRNCGMTRAKDIVASSPYFRLNPELRHKVGLQAPKEVNTMNYGSYMDVEPVSGMTLSARKRFQWNVRLRRDPNHPILSKLTEESVLIPLLWVEEAIDLDEKNAKLFRDNV